MRRPSAGPGGKGDARGRRGWPLRAGPVRSGGTCRPHDAWSRRRGAYSAPRSVLPPRIEASRDAPCSALGLSWATTSAVTSPARLRHVSLIPDRADRSALRPLVPSGGVNMNPALARVARGRLTFAQQRWRPSRSGQRTLITSLSSMYSAPAGLWKGSFPPKKASTGWLSRSGQSFRSADVWRERSPIVRMDRPRASRGGQRPRSGG